MSRLGAGWSLVGSLVLAGLILAPARAASLRGDDEWVFGFRGTLALDHQSLLGAIGSQLSASFHGLRLLFLADLISYPALYLFARHPTEYHVYLVGLTVLCAGLLWALVRQLHASASLALLVVVLFAAGVQFRFFHDAVLGYYGDTQFVFALTLLSLLAMLRTLRGGGLGWALAAALLFAGACASQQWALPLCATHLALALTERRDRRALLAAGPAVLIGIVFLFGGALGQTSLASQPVSGGYSVALNAGHVITSYVTQLLPALPTSNRLFSQGPVAYFYGNALAYPLGGHPSGAELLAALWRGLAVLAVTLAVLLLNRRRATVDQLVPRTVLQLGVVGLCFWLTPPLLVAVAQKYQVELNPARGYVEVLVQTAGVALIVVALLLMALRVSGRRTSAAVAVGAAVVCGLAATVDGFNNIRVIGLEQPVRQTRDLLEAAAGHGLLNEMPARSTLLLSGHDMDWPSGTWGFGANTGEAVLLTYARREFDVRWDADQTPLTCGSSPTFPPPSCAAPEPSAAWVRIRALPDGGVVTLAQIPHPTAATVQSRAASALWVYVQGSGATPPPPALAGTLPGNRPWSQLSVAWRRLRSGSGWAIYRAVLGPGSAPLVESLNDPASRIDFLHPLAPDQTVRVFGARSLLP